LEVEAAAMDFQQALQDVCGWAESHGIAVRQLPLGPGKAGAFDGLSVTLSPGYRAEDLTYYLAHALGSMVLWSSSRGQVQGLFKELRAAKADRGDAARLERALEAYGAFEAESSELAVWLLTELGHGDMVPSYTNFMRADLEALTVFHRTGQVPAWRSFFAQWNEEVATGRRIVPLFHPRPIPAFTPVAIENQEIVQGQEAGPQAPSLP